MRIKSSLIIHQRAGLTGLIRVQEPIPPNATIFHVFVNY